MASERKKERTSNNDNTNSRPSSEVLEHEAKKRKTRDVNQPLEPAAPVIHIVEGPLVQSYGELFQGIQVTHKSTPETLAIHKRRWLARYQLAQLSTQPEGLYFTLAYPDGQTRTARLLSPPDMVAEHDEAGQWRRRQRDVVEDGPPPHSDAFYQEYLHRNRLPYWFFRQGHLVMLDDMAEARVLEMEIPETPRVAVLGAPSQAQVSETRALMREIHVNHGGIVNPKQIPAGRGRWEWLDATDEAVAQASCLGTSFEDLVNAGTSAVDVHHQERPSVVFYPKPKYLNPVEEPQGPGRWAFLTSDEVDSDEMAAAVQLGGQSGLSSRPTASQIFQLRQQCRAQHRKDITESIRLVWVPNEDAQELKSNDLSLTTLPDTEPTLFITGDTSSSPSSSPEPTTTPSFLAPSLPPSSFDPTNNQPGSKTDQTATLSPPRYYTCRIPPTPNGKTIALDRARPHVGLVEEHKTLAYTTSGWIQHPKTPSLDWNDKKQVAALARWRDQILRRNGWPKLREEAREEYAEDERRWLESCVREKVGGGEAWDVVGTWRAFNERFGGRGERTECAIGSVMLRMKRGFLA